MSCTKAILLGSVLFHPVFVAAQTQLEFPGSPGWRPVRMLVKPTGDTIFVGTSPDRYEGILFWREGAFKFSNGAVGGGSGTDIPIDATLDSDGNIWIVGTTTSQDFLLVNPIVSVNGPGKTTGFVMELDPSGATVKFSSYLGGTEPNSLGYFTRSTAITADASGNIYVGGSTDESAFPVTPGAYLTTGPALNGGLGNAVYFSYVAKISAAGKLVWATFLGTGGRTCFGVSSCVGSEGTSAGVDALTVDAAGAVTAAESLSGASAALVRLTPDASKIVWTTSLVKPNNVTAHLSLTSDGSGNIALCGISAPANTTGLYFLTGTPNLFAAKVSSSGSILYQTDVGGASSDANNAGISLDSAGNLWLSGTDSSQTGAMAGAANAGADFILKLDPSGNAIGPPIRFPRGVLDAGAAVTAQGQVLIPGENGALLTLLPGFSAQNPGIVGFTNAASFAMNTGLYPGALISIFGFGLPSPAPQIMIDGILAPVLYAGPNQINLQVPFGVHLGFPVIVVQIGGPLGNLTASVQVSRALGIFTSDGVHAAAVNQDGTVNSASHPAAKGSIVTFYGTGAVWPAGMADGAIPTAAASLDQEINGFQFIDDAAIPQFIQYAGAAPQIIDGVFQLNVTIPGNAKQPFTLQSVSFNNGPVISANPVQIYLQ